MSHMDTKAIALQNPLFALIDEETEKFFSIMKNKKIEPLSIHDLGKIAILFENLTKKIKHEIKKTNFDEEIKKIMYSRYVIGLYGKVAEDFNLPFEMIAPSFGPASVKELKECMLSSII